VSIDVETYDAKFDRSNDQDAEADPRITASFLHASSQRKVTGGDVVRRQKKYTIELMSGAEGEQ
jgi:hypothetical protein